MSYPIFNAFSKETIPPPGQFPMVVADHSTVVVTVNGIQIALYNGAEINDKRKGINADSVWFKLTSVESTRLKKLDIDLLRAIHEYLVENIDGNVTFKERKVTDTGEYDVAVTDKGAKNAILIRGEDWSKKVEISETGRRAYIKFKINTLIELLLGLEDETLRETILDAIKATKLNIKGIEPLKVGEEFIKYLNKDPEHTLFEMIDQFLLKNKPYYIHQVIGNLIGQQPFGGFSLPSDISMVYKSPDNFNRYLESFGIPFLESGGHLFGCENAGTFPYGNHHSIEDKGILDRELKKDTNTVQAYGVHLPSSGVGNRESLYAIVTAKNKELGGKPFIVLGDTNITNSKIKGEEPLNLKASAEEMSRRTGNKVRIVMRNVLITKSREGGPFTNAQIYKSGVETTEQDGMMVIVIGEADIVEDDTHDVIVALPSLEGSGRVRKARKSRKAKKHSKRARRGGSRKNKSKKQKKSRKN